MTEAKRWFELECQHCGQRFLDMAKLLFHHCPVQVHAHGRPRKGDRRPGRGKVGTTTQGLLPSGEGAR